MKVILSSKRTLAILIFITFGLLYAIAPSDFTYNITLKIVASFLVLDGIFKLILADIKTLGEKEYILDIIEGFVAIVLGVISFKFCNYNLVPFLCGIIYLCIPIIRIILAQRKINQLLIDSLKYLAIIVLVSSFNRTFMSNIVISSLFFIIAIFILITLIIKIRKFKTNGVVVYEENKEEKI